MSTVLAAALASQRLLLLLRPPHLFCCAYACFPINMVLARCAYFGHLFVSIGLVCVEGQLVVRGGTTNDLKSRPPLLFELFDP